MLMEEELICLILFNLCLGIGYNEILYYPNGFVLGLYALSTKAQSGLMRRVLFRILRIIR